MPSLSTREQLLVLAILVAVLVGAAVKHWRDSRRDARLVGVQHVARTEN